MILTLVGIMLVFLMLGFPMMIPLILAPLVVVIFFFPNVEPFFMIQQMLEGISNYALLAVPLFIFAADIMSKGRTSNRLLDFIGAFVGHLRGGYAITTAAACAVFGSISGSTQATVVAIGKPMRERLLKIGYKDSTAIAFIINASDVALIIPPSIAMIIYALISGTSVGDLFIAGIGPGILVLFCFALYGYIHAKINNIPLADKIGWKERGVVTYRAILPLLFQLLLLAEYTQAFSRRRRLPLSLCYMPFCLK